MHNNILKKNKKIVVTYKYTYINFLNELVQLNLINAFKFSKKTNLITIFYKKRNQLNHIKQIKFYSCATNKIILNSKQLKQLTETTSKTIYFLSTSNGICNNFKSIKDNRGGLLLFKIVV